MRRDLLSLLYDRVAGIVAGGPCPGASARSRYTAILRKEIQ